MIEYIFAYAKILRTASLIPARMRWAHEKFVNENLSAGRGTVVYSHKDVIHLLNSELEIGG